MRTASKTRPSLHRLDDRRTKVRLAFLALALAVAPACGYKSTASARRDLGVRTLAIQPLDNVTTTFEIETFVRRALVHAFVEASPFRVIDDPSRADAVLSGAVTSVSANPVIFRDSSLGSTFLVRMRADIALQDRRTGRILFSQNGFIFREQYQINTDVQEFFSEQNPAFRRVAEDFANSVVATIVDGF